jgi:hypothetical protein
MPERWTIRKILRYTEEAQPLGFASRLDPTGLATDLGES